MALTADTAAGAARPTNLAPGNGKPYRLENVAGRYFDAAGNEISQQKFIDHRLDEGYAMIEAMKRRLVPDPSCRVCRGTKGWVSYGIDPKGDMYLNVCCGRTGKTDFTELSEQMLTLNMQQARAMQLTGQMGEAIQQGLTELYRGTLFGRMHWLWWNVTEWWKNHYGPAPKKGERKPEEPAPQGDTIPDPAQPEPIPMPEEYLPASERP